MTPRRARRASMQPSAPKTLAVRAAWRPAAPSDERVRARIMEELEQASWTLSQMEALLYDAHQLAGVHHAWLLPRLEMRLPLYDLGLRYRLVYTCLDRTRLAVEDDRGRRVADVTLP